MRRVDLTATATAAAAATSRNCGNAGELITRAAYSGGSMLRVILEVLNLLAGLSPLCICMMLRRLSY